MNDRERTAEIPATHALLEYMGISTELGDINYQRLRKLIKSVENDFDHLRLSQHYTIAWMHLEAMMAAAQEGQTSEIIQHIERAEEILRLTVKERSEDEADQILYRAKAGLLLATLPSLCLITTPEEIAEQGTLNLQEDAHLQQNVLRKLVEAYRDTKRAELLRELYTQAFAKILQNSSLMYEDDLACYVWPVSPRLEEIDLSMLVIEDPVQEDVEAYNRPLSVSISSGSGVPDISLPPLLLQQDKFASTIDDQPVLAMIDVQSCFIDATGQLTKLEASFAAFPERRSELRKRIVSQRALVKSTGARYRIIENSLRQVHRSIAENIRKQLGVVPFSPPEFCFNCPEEGDLVAAYHEALTKAQEWYQGLSAEVSFHRPAMLESLQEAITAYEVNDVRLTHGQRIELAWMYAELGESTRDSRDFERGLEFAKPSNKFGIAEHCEATLAGAYIELQRAPSDEEARGRAAGEYQRQLLAVCYDFVAHITECEQRHQPIPESLRHTLERVVIALIMNGEGEGHNLVFIPPPRLRTDHEVIRGADLHMRPYREEPDGTLSGRVKLKTDGDLHLRVSTRDQGIALISPSEVATGMSELLRTAQAIMLRFDAVAWGDLDYGYQEELVEYYAILDEVGRAFVRQSEDLGWV